jgi:hypothetical protein
LWAAMEVQSMSVYLFFASRFWRGLCTDVEVYDRGILYPTAPVCVLVAGLCGDGLEGGAPALAGLGGEVFDGGAGVDGEEG